MRIPIVLPVLAFAALAGAQDERTADARLHELVTLDGEHPWTPPATLAAWEERASRLRTQVGVAAGLWPLPERTPLVPTIHGRIERDGYSVEKVFFESQPGVTVTGNLYRPAGAGPFAGVLSPHGHWAGGRFSERTPEEARAEIDAGAEEHSTNARYHLQARCAQLARMGCVVFHYDMAGYADASALPHGGGFADVEAELHSLSAFGLQTWSSIRALDFLAGLPDVDPGRIGVTGASGGGTQTFVLCALDERPRVAFPAVMVSTRMQGGCVCENASHLRVGTNNVEIAALMAPRPLALSGADDWTKEIEREGLPELRAVYSLYGVPERVQARCWPQFPHNFNLPARLEMYAWFAKHLGLAVETPIVEAELEPIPPAELSVFDADHPLPAGAFDLERARAHMLAAAARARARLVPRDPAGLGEHRRVVGGALVAMLHPDGPPAGGEEPLRVRRGAGSGRGLVLLVAADPAQAEEPAAALAAAGLDVALVPVLGAGVPGTRLPVDSRHATFVGYTWGYNRTLIAERVRDVLAAVARARALPGVERVHLLGVGEAGPWALLASALAGDAVDRTLCEWSWTFAGITALDDPNLLPGALRQGGLPAFAGLCAPRELCLVGPEDVPEETRAVYAADGSTSRVTTASDLHEGIAWLVRE